MRLLGVLVAVSVLAIASANAAAPKDYEPYGNVLVFDAASGAWLRNFPVLRGSGVAVDDGRGGFFVDAFPDGARRLHGFTHVRADGSLDRGFRVKADAPLAPLARAGPTVYAADSSVSLCPIADPDCDPFRLRAVDVRTGNVLPWPARPPRDAGLVNAVAVVAGNVIAAGKGYVAAFDAQTAVRKWSLRLRRAGSAASVHGLATAGGRLFAVGAFSGNVVEIAPRRGVVEAWRPTTPIGEELYSIAASRDALFVGGISRGYRIDLATRRPTPLPGRPTIVGLGGGRLYLGGNVRYPLRLAPSNLASVDLATDRLRIVPRVAKFQSVGQIAVSGRHVLASGLFAVKFR